MIAVTSTFLKTKLRKTVDWELLALHHTVSSGRANTWLCAWPLPEPRVGGRLVHGSQQLSWSSLVRWGGEVPLSTGPQEASYRGLTLICPFLSK